MRLLPGPSSLGIFLLHFLRSKGRYMSEFGKGFTIRAQVFVGRMEF